MRWLIVLVVVVLSADFWASRYAYSSDMLTRVDRWTGRVQDLYCYSGPGGSFNTEWDAAFVHVGGRHVCRELRPGK